MTPEDTPRMAERTDRQAQIDPWADVNEIELSKTPGIGFVYQASVVDAARAADAALLRERDAQIASLQEHLGRMLANRYDADNVTLRAERDAAQQENKTLREALDNSDMEVELLEAYVEDLRTICEQANIDPDAARVALSSSPRQQEPQP